MTDRARVPFALVGVLLLVGSATLSTSLAPRAPPATDPDTERAVERAVAETNTALRAGTRTAAREAARDPVVVPANTSAGRVLNDTTPFRDALRLRIYLAVRERLARVDARIGDTRATASLPPPDDLRAAIERVHVEAAGPNDTRLRVRVANVTVAAERGGRVVERVERERTLVVRTPVLAVHRRVMRFERRLNRGPLRPGLGRRLTTQLYPVAWVRGYAQHRGTPIANVLANRHVALATNRGVYDLQRRTFGTGDPATRRALAEAGERVAVRDLLAGTPRQSNAALARALLDAATNQSITLDALRAGPDGTGAPAPDSPVRVGVNRSALRAFAAFTDGNLSSALAAAYTTQARLAVDTDRLAVEQRGTATLPGWTLVDEQSTTSTTVHGAAASPDTPANWTTVESYARRVERVRTTRRTWRRDDRTRTTRTTRTTTDRVSIAVVVRPHPETPAPPVGVETAFDRDAGPFDGPNLADTTDAATRRLVAGRGGVDALARRAAAGRLDRTPVRIAGARPAGLREWLYDDLVALRKRVENVSVRTRRGAVGAYEVNPPAALAAKLRERRAALVDAPRTYRTTAAKARAAARAAYLDAVVASLEARAAERRARATRLNETLVANGAGSLSRLRSVLDGRERASGTASRSLSLAVDGAPPYLTLASVEGRHPLAARNLNVFTTPHGDAADAVVGALSGAERVDLRTAARTLGAADRIPARNDTLDSRRARLRRQVERSNERLRAHAVSVFRAHGIGNGPRARRVLVDAALARWSTPAARALALTNGSAATAIVAVADERDAVASHRDRDRLRVGLRLALGDARTRDDVRVPRPPVARTANVTRAVGTELLRGLVDSGVDSAADAARRRALGRTLGAVPAGLPVAPVPGYWYATANVWHVEVRGAYDRFVVRAARGGPRRSLAYVRDGAAVRLDVDGDGNRERLGRAARVSFETDTTVLVVVPPTGTGVGDTDGQADERSSGWSRTG